MKHGRGSWLANLAAQLLLGAAGLAVITLVCFQLGVGLASTAFAYVTLVTVLSLIGSFIGAVILSIVAVACLNYFFAPPLFSFRVDYPLDILAIVAFLAVSLQVTALMARLRKTAEDTEASRRELVDTIPALAWTALPDGSHDFHNRGWLEFSGMSPTEAVGDGWVAILHPEDRETILEKWRRAVASGEAFEIEARARTASGEYRALLVRAAPIRDERGKIVKWYGISTDVAVLRQAQADLREREARIRRLVDANIIGIYIWDFDGRILEANDAFLRIVGYDREDLIADRLRLRDLTPPEWLELHTQALKEAKTTGAVQPFEKEYFRKDGSRVSVLIGGASFEEDGNQGVAFVLDLTERKRAEEALRASEDRFRDYVDVASDWFWETGPDHRFTEFSQSAADWGLLEALIGKKRWDLAVDREEEPEKWRAHIATLDAHQPFRGFRYKILHPDGSARYVSVSGKPVFDGSGAFLGYRGVATDVSAEVRAEKALRESEERFRTLMQFSFDVYWETDAQHRFIRQDFSERVTDGPLPGSELGKTRWEVPYLDIDEEAWRKHREMLDAHLPFRDLEYAQAHAQWWQALRVGLRAADVRRGGALHRLSRRRTAYHRAQTNRGSTSPAGEGASRNRRDHSGDDCHDCARWTGRIYWQAVFRIFWSVRGGSARLRLEGYRSSGRS